MIREQLWDFGGNILERTVLLKADVAGFSPVGGLNNVAHRRIEAHNSSEMSLEWLKLNRNFLALQQCRDSSHLDALNT